MSSRIANMSNLFFVVVNYHSTEQIERLLNSLANNSPEQFRVVIINNSASDRQILKLKRNLVNIIEAGDNLGFGRACNLGLNWIYEQDSRAIAWLINPDTYFEAESTDNIESPIDSAIALFKKYPDLSIVGTTVYDTSGKLTDAGGKFTPGTAALSIVDVLPANCAAEYLPTDWVSGCSMIINLANFAKCPQFDPRYFLYYEDLDFCLRYGQKHKIAITPTIKVVHETSSITNRNLLAKYQHITHSYLIHVEKHGDLSTFIVTNLRMSLNTLRLLILKPQQGWGKLVGIYNYWRSRLIKSR